MRVLMKQGEYPAVRRAVVAIQHNYGLLGLGKREGPTFLEWKRELKDQNAQLLDAAPPLGECGGFVLPHRLLLYRDTQPFAYLAGEHLLII